VNPRFVALIPTVLALVTGLIAGTGGNESPSESRSDEPKVEEFVVAEIPVILKHIEANRIVAVQLFIRGGSANLSPETAGIERLLFLASERGTQKYPKDVYHARLAATGTSIKGAPTYDFSTFSLQTVRDGWDEAWDLYTQALLHPTLDSTEVEIVRGQLLNAVRQRRDNPDSYVRDLSDSLFYEGHPYALNPEGTEKALAAITVDQLREWQRGRLTRDNLVLVVVGDVSRADLEAKVQTAFGALPATGQAGRAVPLAQARTPAVAVVERALPTNYIRGSFQAPSLINEEDYAALSVGLEVLSDRFFEEVRTKRNLSYAVAAALSSRLSNYGLLYVSAVHPDTTLKVMLDEVRRMQREPLPAKRLEQAIKVFVTSYYLGLQANAAQAMLLGRYELLGGGWEEAYDFIDEVQEVTAADVLRVMNEYVKGVHFVVLGDPVTLDRTLFTSL
jgi:zinc protease